MHLLNRSDLLQEGHTDDDIARLVRKGELHRVRRGIYSRQPLPDDHHHVALALAAASLHKDAVLSHTSAALLHALPVRRAARSRVTMTKPSRSSGKHRRGVVVTSARLADADLTHRHGCRTTTVARTLVDLGRSEPLDWAVAAVDHALRTGQVQRRGLDEALDRLGPVRGTRAARRAVALADARAESPGESLSRVLFVLAGLAPDELQKKFPHSTGVDRVDFFWECGVIGEFDGFEKYAGDPRKVWDEKRREDRLRRQGYEVVRWVWDDLWNRPDEVIRWIKDAMARVLKRRRPRSA